MLVQELQLRLISRLKRWYETVQLQLRLRRWTTPSPLGGDGPAGEIPTGDSRLVECVPNFSEGRDKSNIDAIVNAAKSVDGVRVLDVEMDADHNRSVLSFVASPEAALEACFLVARKSAELIDLNHHKGEHPRMGAVDVIPFIPVDGSTIEDCVQLAKKLGEKIGRDLKIPVYLYDRAAVRPERKDLASVRKGQFEGLREEIGKNPDRTPDFGPNKIHPTAGAVAVGAREQIINFNVNLLTQDMELGKAIAKKIRASSGGFPCVRAKEIHLEKKKQVQISTVLTDYRTTSIYTVFEAVRAEAMACGVEVVETEIVGLVPQASLVGYAVEGLKLKSFNPEAQILENRLAAQESDWQSAARRMIAALAETTATPGGGSGAAIAGAMGCALGRMALGISLQSKKTEEYKKPALQAALNELQDLGQQIEACMSEDAAAFDAFMEVLKLPKENPDRPLKIQQALKHAAEVPLKTAQLSLKAFRRLNQSESLAMGTVGSDMKCAMHLAHGAIRCAIENVKINLDSIKDPQYTENLRREIGTILNSLPLGPITS
ncbi:MAG: glutamate formimidoyltransferase [Elusimicrobia bacterium]|nr:glutamate formimidoyltransferase [Elusimicrobiota bacterium]